VIKVLWAAGMRKTRDLSKLLTIKDATQLAGRAEVGAVADHRARTALTAATAPRRPTRLLAMARAGTSRSPTRISPNSMSQPPERAGSLVAPYFGLAGLV